MTRKLSLEEIMTAGILQEQGHKYLLDYLTTAPSPIGIYEHPETTKTCAEKIALLNQTTGVTWELKQAVRAVYFSHAKLYQVVVTPEMGKPVNSKAAFGMGLGVSGSLPDYMEQGTCTPFITETDIAPCAGSVQNIYIHPVSKHDLTMMLADFSIGGRGEDARKRSLWMPYQHMVDLLAKQFGDIVTVKDVYTVDKESKPFKRKPDEVKSHG